MYSMKKYIPISFTYIAIVAMFFMCLVKSDLFRYTPIQNLGQIIVAVYIASNIQNIKKKYMGIETVLFAIYLIWSIIASYMNVGGVITTNPFASSLSYVLSLAECYLLIVIIADKGEINRFLNIIYRYTFVILLMNDLLILAGATLYNNLVGNKFETAYLHIIFLVLYVIKYRLFEHFDWLRCAGFLGVLIISLAIIIKTGCSTGLVGVVLLLCLLFMCYRGIGLFDMRILATILTIACMLFPFWYNFILSNYYVKYFVEDVLHKQITLTGRTYIYNAVLYLLGTGWQIGYGIGTNYEICMRFGFVNIQNGLLKILMESGIAGVLSIILLIVLAFSRAKDNKELKVYAAYITVFIVLSSVEVTITKTFLFWLMFLLVYARTINSREELSQRL